MILGSSSLVASITGNAIGLLISGFNYTRVHPTIICGIGSEYVGSQYSDSLSQTNLVYSCQACPFGKYSLAPSTWTNGQYLSRCNNCPTADVRAVSCPGGSAVMSQPGYCVFLTEPNLLGYAECPNRQACIKIGNESQFVSDSRRTLTMLGASEKCTEGYSGMQCSECDDGHFARKLQQLTCLKCPETKGLNVAVYWLHALVVFGIAVTTTCRAFAKERFVSRCMRQTKMLRRLLQRRPQRCCMLCPTVVV